MKNPTITEILNWSDQIEQDAVARALKTATHSAREIEAYRAGIREGARQMRAVLTLHGHLVTGNERGSK